MQTYMKTRKDSSHSRFAARLNSVYLDVLAGVHEMPADTPTALAMGPVLRHAHWENLFMSWGPFAFPMTP